MRSSSQTHMHHMANAQALVVQHAASHVFQKECRGDEGERVYMHGSKTVLPKAGARSRSFQLPSPQKLLVALPQAPGQSFLLLAENKREH